MTRVWDPLLAHSLTQATSLWRGQCWVVGRGLPHSSQHRSPGRRQWWHHHSEACATSIWGGHHQAVGRGPRSSVRVTQGCCHRKDSSQSCGGDRAWGWSRYAPSPSGKVFGLQPWEAFALGTGNSKGLTGSGVPHSWAPAAIAGAPMAAAIGRLPRAPGKWSWWRYHDKAHAAAMLAGHCQLIGHGQPPASMRGGAAAAAAAAAVGARLAAGALGAAAGVAADALRAAALARSGPAHGAM